MPRMCSVQGCRSNYRGEKTVNTFSLPKDPELKQKWLKAIPNDLTHLKSPTICILHFQENAIIRVDRVMYLGKMREYPRERPKLSENAVPSIFPHTPNYPTNSSDAYILPDVDDAPTEEATKDSVKDDATNLNKSIKISCLEDICVALEKMDNYQKQWTYVKDDAKTTICFVNFNGDQPCVNDFIVIFENLTYNVFINNVQMSNVDKILNCKCIDTTSLLEKIFEFVHSKKTDSVLKVHLDIKIET